MRESIALAILAMAAYSAASQAQTGIDKRLMALEPNTRLIQVCNLSGLQTLGRDKAIAKVDRVLVDAISPPAVEGNTAKGSGGAVRSGKQWYRFSFTCALTPDRMKATAFTYKIDRQIPKEQWEKFNLW